MLPIRNKISTRLVFYAVGPSCLCLSKSVSKSEIGIFREVSSSVIHFVQPKVWPWILTTAKIFTSSSPLKTCSEVMEFCAYVP